MWVRGGSFVWSFLGLVCVRGSGLSAGASRSCSSLSFAWGAVAPSAFPGHCVLRLVRLPPDVVLRCRNPEEGQARSKRRFPDVLSLSCMKGLYVLLFIMPRLHADCVTVLISI